MDELPPHNRTDPHRRLLRHTYQEGPDFLFLATRGGRPPGPDQRQSLAALRLRVRAVRVARDEGIAAALGLGVSRASLHRWRCRYEAGGLDALLNRSRGPTPARLPAWVEQAVIVARLLTYWNSKRLAAEFSRREIYPLDHHAVDGLLAELGTARPSVRLERGPAYERSRPNELWHNGSPFVVWMPGVLTLFGKTLEELQIRHIRTQVNSPWTNGKIERFWGVLQSELLDRQIFRTLEAAADGLTGFATYYNYDRLHGELDWHTPAERYDGTPFVDRGFEHIPALAHLQDWLSELKAA